MFTKMLGVTIVLFLISGATADTCPTVEPMASFESEKYLGKWYDVEHYPAFFLQGQKCNEAMYSANTNGTITVVNSAKVESGEKKETQGLLEMKNEAEKAKLSILIPSPTSNREGPYWIADTDYTTYSVVWSCVEDEKKGPIKYSWILTRERTPSAEVLEKVYKILETKKIAKDLFEKTDQTNC